MHEHMKLLGLKVRDVVSGLEGVVTTMAFDLYGCVQAIVTQLVDKKTGKAGEQQWYDTKRLKVLSQKPVMDVPDFAVVPGGAEKSLPPSGPR